MDEWTSRYRALMEHYGMVPTTNNAGLAHENGDVEQSHHRFKSAVDQKLSVRGSRDFESRQMYGRFLEELVKKRNQTRQARYAEEQRVLRPLPAVPLLPAKALRVRASRFSTVRVLGNTYSVPSRLIGTMLTVRVRAETLQLYQGSVKLFELPRLLGQGKHRIEYRHLSWLLVRKPGAFAAYRYREELFPSLAFRRAYDRLTQGVPEPADREYVRLLHLAALAFHSGGLGTNLVRYPRTGRIAQARIPRATRLAAGLVLISLSPIRICTRPPCSTTAPMPRLICERVLD